RVEEAETVGKLQRLTNLQTTAATDSPGRRVPFPDSIGGDDGRFVERGGEECRCSMRFVVLEKGERALPSSMAVAHVAPNVAREVQLEPEPERHRSAKGRKAERHGRQVG